MDEVKRMIAEGTINISPSDGVVSYDPLADESADSKLVPHRHGVKDMKPFTQSSRKKFKLFKMSNTGLRSGTVWMSTFRIAKNLTNV